MKLIYATEQDGSEHYFNPIHIKHIKVVHSEYNQDWCIVLNLMENKSFTILCESEEERDNKIAEIKEAMESVFTLCEDFWGSN